MDTPLRKDPLLAAEELLGDLAARAAEGQRADIDSLVRAHPSVEAELRALHGAGAEVDADLGKARGALAAEQVRVDAILAQLGGESPTSTRRRYVLEGEVGKGGMGVVYRVRDTKLDRHLAMKVILGQADATRSGKTPPVEANRLLRFVNEAKITGQLDHPGIVPVHEVGVDDEGRAYFTMKLVKGITFADVLERRAANDPEWSMPRVLAVLQRVCEAMAFAHERGVIHRDLKPANIMVGDFGEVYVMDWGLAQRDHDAIEVAADDAKRRAQDTPALDPLVEHMSLTRVGQVLGTPAYMSPEQAEGRINDIGPQSDVYAIGAMLYQLIAGHAPYCKPRENTPGDVVLRCIVVGPPAPLSEQRAPPELLAICERAMQRHVEDRYASTRALSLDLEAFLDGRVVRAYEAGAWAEARKWVKRNRALAMALSGGILVLLVGSATVLVLKKESDENARSAQVNAEDARSQATIAKANAEQALASELRAKAEQSRAQLEKANVLKLKAFQTLDDLTKEADGLWPAEPKWVPRYRDWMKRAEDLVAQKPDFKASLAEIESRAVPQSESEQALERSTHPRAQELGWKRARSLWMSRMLERAPWPTESDVEAELARDVVPTNARDLTLLAWTLVNPDKPVHGSEVKALILARSALALADASERVDALDVLAWCYYRLGRFQEAVDAESRAGVEGDSPRKRSFQKTRDMLASSVSLWRDADGNITDFCLRAESQFAQECAELEAEVSKRRTWQFEGDVAGVESGERWWHDQLLKLIAALDSFADRESGLMHGVSTSHGWGIAKRLEFASNIEARTVSGEEARPLWSDACAAIAGSPKYSGLKLTPQVGLLPLGVDRESGLWEFAHLQTGLPAERGLDGQLIVTPETGLVFVLLPGGTFSMGAQNTDSASPNYDGLAEPFESPVHRVTLSAFLVSKYEMTQGQWLRITGSNPSSFGPAIYAQSRPYALNHPVERVSWNSCSELMKRLGLALPSEAHWEYAARGGKDTPWWTGADQESLRDKINIADLTAKRGGAKWDAIAKWPDFVDGWVCSAPVGAFAANPFGLHEVLGNVWEWCLDGFDAYSPGEQVDPVVFSSALQNRVIRGGSFAFAASDARAAFRYGDTPDTEDDNLGLRPVRFISP